MNKELAKTLTIALVNYIDENRPEGTMDCSSGECERLEKAFEANNLDFVEGFMEKKLSRLSEFEKCMLDFAKARDEYEYDSMKVAELNDKVIELTKSYSKKLLSLAKEECKNQIESDYRGLIYRAYEEGRAYALKDLPRWRRDDSIEAEQYITVYKNGSRFHYKGHSLLISDLTKLPGFKEDEK